MAIEDVLDVLNMADELRRQMTAHDFSVLMVLAWHKNEQTGQCNPGYATLARETCLSRDTVAKAVKHLKLLDVVEIHQGNANTSNAYVLTFSRYRGVRSQPTHAQLSAGMGSQPMGGEPLELNIQSQIQSQSQDLERVPRVSSRQKTEEQQQEQKQQQKQRHGGDTPVPPMVDYSIRSACEELARVWKEVSQTPCYPKNFAELLGQYELQHIAAAIRWTFTISKYWEIKNTGHFCKPKVFLQILAQYETYMQRVRESDKKKKVQDVESFSQAKSLAQSSPKYGNDTAAELFRQRDTVKSEPVPVQRLVPFAEGERYHPDVQDIAHYYEESFQHKIDPSLVDEWLSCWNRQEIERAIRLGVLDRQKCSITDPEAFDRYLVETVETAAREGWDR